MPQHPGVRSTHCPGPLQLANPALPAPLFPLPPLLVPLFPLPPLLVPLLPLPPLLLPLSSTAALPPHATAATTTAVVHRLRSRDVIVCHMALPLSCIRGVSGGSTAQ